MRYLESENPYIWVRFNTGDTATITIYDSSDDSVVVNSASMSELSSTGFFKYLFNPSPATLTYYFYIASTTNEEHAGTITLGGYPDGIKDETDKIQAVDDNVDAVLTDTDDLQTNQGNWLTATGFSVPNEYDSELAAIQADLDDPNQYKADVSLLALEANVEGHVVAGLQTHDAPTNTDLQATEASIIAEVNANEVKIDSIITSIGLLNDISVTDVQTAMDNQGYTAIRAALLDNLDMTISALNNLSIADVQTALSNQGYTVARAMLLDNLTNLDNSISNVLVAIASLNDLSSADVQVAMTAQGYTTVRAALLDNLDNSISNVIAALLIVQTDLDNPNQYKADISGLAPVNEYDPELDAIQADLTLLKTNVQDISSDLIAMQIDVTFLKDIEGGSWKREGTQMIFYKSDNVTEIARFDLKKFNGTPATEADEEVAARIRL